MKQTFLLTLLTSSVLMGLAAAQTGETEVPMGDALFALFNADSDGSVSAEEFTSGLFTRSDLDGSGTLSRVEFNGGKDLFYDGRYEGGDFVPDFNDFDADGNGELSEDEFSTGSTGENYTALYDDFDADDSGGVSQEEFAQGIFGVADDDGSGDLDDDEVREYAGELFPGDFGRLDSSGDGLVTPDEYVAGGG